MKAQSSHTKVAGRGRTPDSGYSSLVSAAAKLATKANPVVVLDSDDLNPVAKGSNGKARKPQSIFAGIAAAAKRQGASVRRRGGNIELNFSE